MWRPSPPCGGRTRQAAEGVKPASGAGLGPDVADVADVADSATSKVVCLSYGDPLPGHGGPLHIDVDAKVFNHGQQLVTVIGVKKATVAGGQQLKPDGLRGFKQVPLEPGGEQKPLEFTLGTVDAAPLSANVGDKLTLTLRVTRCPRAPRARFRLTSPS